MQTITHTHTHISNIESSSTLILSSQVRAARPTTGLEVTEDQMKPVGLC